MLSAANQIYFKHLRRFGKWLEPKASVVFCCCLLGAASTFAQVSNPLGNVVLVRHARVADCESNKLFEATVLVKDGKMIRLDAATPVPSEAVVLDGGGGILTLAGDGKIILWSEKGNPFFAYQTNRPAIKVAIALAAGELYESLLEFDSPDRARFDCLPASGDFISPRYFNPSRFRKNMLDKFPENPPRSMKK
jgi:hypothetical protein